MLLRKTSQEGPNGNKPQHLLLQGRKYTTQLRDWKLCHPCRFHGSSYNTFLALLNSIMSKILLPDFSTSVCVMHLSSKWLWHAKRDDESDINFAFANRSISWGRNWFLPLSRPQSSTINSLSRQIKELLATNHRPADHLTTENLKLTTYWRLDRFLLTKKPLTYLVASHQFTEH